MTGLQAVVDTAQNFNEKKYVQSLLDKASDEEWKALFSSLLKTAKKEGCADMFYSSHNLKESAADMIVSTAEGKEILIPMYSKKARILVSIKHLLNDFYTLDNVFVPDYERLLLSITNLAEEYMKEKGNENEKK